MLEKMNTPTKRIFLAMILGASIYGNLTALYQDYVGKSELIHMIKTQWMDSSLSVPLHSLYLFFAIWAAWCLILHSTRNRNA